MMRRASGETVGAGWRKLKKTFIELGRLRDKEKWKPYDLPSNHTEDETDDPHPYCHDGHFWIVDIGNGGTDLGKGTVLFVDSVKVELHPRGDGERCGEGEM